jgi:FtsH-binding integral membrane protein
MQSVVQGERLSPGQAISLSLTCWGRLLLTYILTALAISTGLLLLILPGIYIGTRLAFAEFYCVMEGKGPMESIRASWDSSSEFFWPLLQGLALIFSVLMLAELLIAQVFRETPILMLLLSLLVQFLGVLSTIYAYRLYCVMKEEHNPA